MRFRKKIAGLVGQSLTAFLLLSVGATASSNWMSRPGTVQHALGLPDGSHVYLDAVRIRKIRAQQSPAYVVVSEFFSWHDTLITLTSANPLLRISQTIDIEGDLTTLESGERALANVVVWGYTDSAGNLLYHGPLLKGLLEPLPWQWKTNLTVSPSAGGEQSSSTQQGEISPESLFDVELCSSIAEVKSKTPGTVIELRCKPVSTGGSGSFTLGEDGGSDTITTNYTGSVAQTDRICVVRGTVDIDGTVTVLDVDSGPNYNVQESYQGGLLAAPDGTIVWAKSKYDGDEVSLSGKVVTRAWPDYFYIEEDDRSSGIRIQETDHGRHCGERVDVTGLMATNNGERHIDAESITANGSGTLNPVGMNNKLLGGGDVGYVVGPPSSGQRGTIGGAGLNNIGLFVKTWGRITELDSASPPQWFRISDGSGFRTTIAYPPYGYALDDFVGISGISSCEVDSSDLQRVLRPQPLTCTINQASGQSDPTNSTPINFTVVFSEPVTGFDDAGDVDISGSASGTETVTITQTDAEGKEYTVAVSNLAYGAVTAAVPGGKAVNSSGVCNYASTSTDNTVAYCDGIVYVQTPANGGDDSNSGWRWDNAKATVTAALQTAVTYGQSQVWVAKGTYNERITMRPGIGLYGGFAGTESSVNQRAAFLRTAPDANETVLDGQSGGNVVTATTTNANSVLDGFTIRNGGGSGRGVSASSTLSIRNNEIYSNSRGIDISALGSITNNHIFQNTYSGISVSGSAATEVSCNTVENNGQSGIWTNGSSNFIINRNKVIANGANASYGGGICIWGASGSPIVANNYVWGNHASDGGGGIAILTTRSLVYNNTVVGNTCGAYGYGDGIWICSLDGWDVYVCNNIVEGNSGGYGVCLDNYNLNYRYTVYMANNFSSNNGSGNYLIRGNNASFTFQNEQHQGSGLQSGDYHLSSNSPCVNAGTAYAWNSTRYYPPYDLEGEARIASTGIDVGCDELQ